MGVYQNGRENEVGVAHTDMWVALWNPDTPYIAVLDREFFEAHSEDIMAAWRLGGEWSDDAGNGGAVDQISTAGDLDDDGQPLFFDTADEYVANELRMWARDSGVDTGVELIMGGITGTNRPNRHFGY
jgi:hypothetical protein